MIKNNPFLSEFFTGVWIQNFAPNQKVHRFDWLPSLAFTKNPRLPLYTNLGGTMTKGISYELELSSLGEPLFPGEKISSTELPSSTETASKRDFKKKVFLIYDIPTYFEVDTETSDSDLALLRSRQYPGFLIDLNGFGSLNEYLHTTFSKSSRYKLKKYKKRFEASFDVRYVMYRGEMEKETYDTIFESFRELLGKRFNDKQITNNNLDPKEWQFYYEVTYPMLQENKASLFVIYNGDTPIGVTLNFFSDNILFDAITVFDIDYGKFHLGSITIMALMEWCLENDLQFFDFSKGYFDYKDRWATRTYDFEYHIYYDASSVRARAIAYALKKLFDLKQRMRERKLNERLHRLTYRFKNRTPKPLQNRSYTFAETDDSEPIGTERELDLERPGNSEARLLVFEYLYLNDGHYRDIKVFATDKPDEYYLCCKNKQVLATSNPNR